MSNQNSILLVDPSFDPATAPACNLLVKVGLNSFSYAIINRETKQINAIFDEQECEEVEQTLADRLKNDPYLSFPYQEVKFAIASENTIEVPLALFQKDEVQTYAKFFTAPHSENIYAYEQPNLGCISLFSWTDAVDQLISKKFPSSKKLPVSAGLTALAAEMNENTLIFDFTARSFGVIYLQQQQLVFEQSYEIDDVDEFNYFLLLIINQLVINIAETGVHLTGIVHENDHRYNCLAKYFGTINFLTASQNHPQEILEDMPAHYYSSLLALDQCGL